MSTCSGGPARWSELDLPCRTGPRVPTRVGHRLEAQSRLKCFHRVLDGEKSCRGLRIGLPCQCQWTAASRACAWHRHSRQRCSDLIGGLGGLRLRRCRCARGKRQGTSRPKTGKERLSGRPCTKKKAAKGCTKKKRLHENKLHEKAARVGQGGMRQRRERHEGDMHLLPSRGSQAAKALSRLSRAQ